MALKPTKPVVPPPALRSDPDNFSSRIEANLIFQQTMTNYNDLCADFVDERATVASSAASTATTAADTATGAASTATTAADAATSAASSAAADAISANAAAMLNVLAGGRFATYGGTANAITLTSGLSLATLQDGYKFRFRATAINTGVATINLDATGAKTVKTITGDPLPAGYIRLGNTPAAVETVITWSSAQDCWIADRETELGSNANGRFEKFADGRMTCVRDVTKNNGSTNAQTFSWPATFTTTDNLGLSVHNVGGSFGSLLQFETAGVSSFQIRVVNISDASAQNATRSGPVTGMGFWY